MKQENKKNSSYNKIRNNLYANVERHELTERKTFGIVALSALMLASILLFVAAMIETGSKKEYIYVFGDTEQELSEKLAFSDGVQYIDMVALATFCNMESIEKGFAINGTYIKLENGSSLATVNGFNVSLSEKVIIDEKHVLIPIEDAKKLIFGIDIDISGEKTVITATENIYMIAKNVEFDYVTDVSAYLEYINSKDQYISILANKQHSIGEDFSPAKLVEIPKKYRRTDRVLKLDLTAEKALEAMMQDMFALGIDDVCVQSAYRTYAEQQNLFNNYVNSEINKGLSRDEAIANANKYSARPEYSEHRTGLCVDFFVPSCMLELENYGYEGSYPNDVGFTETNAYPWLLKNCWKYGFILRYPEDKVDITGYSYESWHYRFVGLEVASIIHQTGLSYEEYLEIFK
ncbi:MAG: M15 family metallopeptidase [Clostridia bacterium]|nr:M15 family metallopeptidase [Clostridia bacterium]